MIGEPERRQLLEIARASIVARVTGTPAPKPEVDGPSRWQGVFVTVHVQQQLRGCIGHIEPDRPLPQLVAICAAAACSADPRFPPVSSSELPEVQIELSILGPLEAVGAAGEIEIGRHGLVIEQGSRRGLLLPQVATEQQWDAQTFIEQTCRKAGLVKNAWPHGAKLWRFAAEVFGEHRVG